MASGPSAGVWTSCSPPPLMLGFLSAWFCAGLARDLSCCQFLGAQKAQPIPDATRLGLLDAKFIIELGAHLSSCLFSPEYTNSFHPAGQPWGPFNIGSPVHTQARVELFFLTPCLLPLPGILQFCRNYWNWEEWLLQFFLKYWFDSSRLLAFVYEF